MVNAAPSAIASSTPSMNLPPRLAALALALCAVGAQAQDSRVHELERNLRERDKVINELLDRVQALERRVGVARSAAPSTGDMQADATRNAGAGAVAGSGRAPGVVAVEEGAADRALERSLTRQGALLLGAGIMEIEPGISYTRREDSAPGLITSNGVLYASETRRNVDSLRANLALRLGLPWDSQLEFGLPYRRQELASTTSVGFAPIGAESRSATGMGDVRVGLAKTLFREGLWAPDLVGRITWDTNTGKTHGNGVSLGSGFNELTASLTATKRNDPVAFVGGLSYQHAFARDQVQPGGTIWANFGSVVALSPETSLHFLVAGGNQRETEVQGQRIAGSDRTIATFAVGGSTVLARGVLLNLSAGIGLIRDADDFSIMLSLPIRLGGPLF